MSATYSTFEEYKTARVEEVLKGIEEQWKKIESENRLSGLFRELGFRSTADLIVALKKIADGKKAKAASKEKAPKSAKAGKSKRQKITPEVVAKVKELKGQGKSATVISKELGVSAASIYKITSK